MPARPGAAVGAFEEVRSVESRASTGGVFRSDRVATPWSIRALLAGGVLLLALSWWRAEAVPASGALRPELLQEPRQEAVTRAAFNTEVEGVTYSVQPLYTYDLYGLVVSRHDTRVWWNWIHDAWLDRLNAVDLCVVWGRNLESGVYARASYASGQFVCYVSMPDAETYAAFDGKAVSNNHLLTDSPAVARQLRSVRVGDQIHLRGVLAEYAHNHGFAFRRGTSVRRDDQGNGACETVFVEAVEILHRAGTLWRLLAWAGALMLAAGLVRWYRRPFHLDD